jgi:hypothetical protein
MQHLRSQVLVEAFSQCRAQSQAAATFFGASQNSRETLYTEPEPQDVTTESTMLE